MQTGQQFPTYHRMDSGSGNGNTTFFAVRTGSDEHGPTGAVLGMRTPGAGAAWTEKDAPGYSPRRAARGDGPSVGKEGEIPLVSKAPMGDRAKVTDLSSTGPRDFAGHQAVFTGLAGIESYKRTKNLPTVTDNLSVHSAPMVRKAAQMGLIEGDPHAEPTNLINRDSGAGFTRKVLESVASSDRSRPLSPDEVDNARKYTANALRAYRDSKRGNTGPQFSQPGLF